MLDDFDERDGALIIFPFRSEIIERDCERLRSVVLIRQWARSLAFGPRRPLACYLAGPRPYIDRWSWSWRHHVIVRLWRRECRVIADITGSKPLHAAKRAALAMDYGVLVAAPHVRLLGLARFTC